LAWSRWNLLTPLHHSTQPVLHTTATAYPMGRRFTAVRATAFAPKCGQSIPCLYAQNAGARFGKGRSKIAALWAPGRSRNLGALQSASNRIRSPSFCHVCKRTPASQRSGVTWANSIPAPASPKQYLRLLGVAPPFAKTTDFNRRHLGKAMRPILVAGQTCGCVSSISGCGCWTSRLCMPRSFAFRDSTRCLEPPAECPGRHVRDQSPVGQMASR